MADTTSLMYRIGVAVKDAVDAVQGGTGGTTDGGYDDFLSGFGAGSAPPGGGGGGTDPEPEPTTFSANVNTSTNILASSPTNPSGEATIQYALDTEDLYVYDGSLWNKYEND